MLMVVLFLTDAYLSISADKWRRSRLFTLLPRRTYGTYQSYRVALERTQSGFHVQLENKLVIDSRFVISSQDGNQSTQLACPRPDRSVTCCRGWRELAAARYKAEAALARFQAEEAQPCRRLLLIVIFNWPHYENIPKLKQLYGTGKTMSSL